MKVIEYRIPLPCTVEEFRRGLLFSVAEMSMNETGGGCGVEVLEVKSFDDKPLLNGRFTEGQYTKKKYHMNKKIPRWIRWAVPDRATRAKEEAWNAYPYCKTIVTTPEFLDEEKCYIKLQSMHLSDRADTENACELNGKELKKRKIVTLDICDDKNLGKEDLSEKTDPKTFRSTVTGRGPLAPDWIRSSEQIMTVYKAITINARIPLLQRKIENFLMNQYPRVLTKFHREAFCAIDRWHPLSMKEVREMETKVAKQLDKKRDTGEVQGMVAKD